MPPLKAIARSSGRLQPEPAMSCPSTSRSAASVLPLRHALATTSHRPICASSRAAGGRHGRARQGRGRQQAGQAPELVLRMSVIALLGEQALPEEQTENEQTNWRRRRRAGSCACGSDVALLAMAGTITSYATSGPFYLREHAKPTPGRSGMGHDPALWLLALGGKPELVVVALIRAGGLWLCLGRAFRRREEPAGDLHLSLWSLVSGLSDVLPVVPCGKLDAHLQRAGVPALVPGQHPAAANRAERGAERAARMGHRLRQKIRSAAPVMLRCECGDRLGDLEGQAGGRMGGEFGLPACVADAAGP